MRPQLLAATPFSDERHDASAIETKTEEALIMAGLGGLNHEMLFHPVSDNGANMVAGWDLGGVWRTPLRGTYDAAQRARLPRALCHQADA